MKHLTAAPSLAEVPAAYREVIGRALAKDPERRFASVAEMISALPPLAATMAYRPPVGATRAAGEPAPEGGEPHPAPPPPRPPQSAYAGDALPAKSVVAEEEPIWRAIRDGWRATRDSWDNFNTPTKIALIVLGIVAISHGYTWEFALKVGPPVLFLYVCYRIARSIVLKQEARRSVERGAAQNAAAYSSPRGPQASPAAGAAEPSRPAPGDMQATAYYPAGNRAATDWRKTSRRHWKHGSGQRWRRQAAALVVKTPRERLADLAGSMMFAAVIGAVMSVVAVLLRGGDLVAKEQYAWLTVVSVLGSWAVLIPAKYWEGSFGDQTLRRVTMLIVGLGMGAAAYLAADMLMITFPDAPDFHVNKIGSLSNRFYDAKGSPLLYAYLAYFGALFAGVRWWRQADPLRRTRLSVWNTGVSVFGAWAVDWIWAFPQPWGLMVAAIISISVQLVSPFVPQHERLARQTGAE
jgi:hypothetical protein